MEPKKDDANRLNWLYLELEERNTTKIVVASAIDPAQPEKNYCE